MREFDLDEFVIHMEIRMKNKLCKSCDLDKNKKGQNWKEAKCRQCHFDMQASAKVDE